jgi:uncharacterized repeat protein (TIGR03803 family)
VFERLHTFSGKHGGGIYMQGGLLAATDGWVYGATTTGGFDDGGTIFRVKPDHTFETVTGFQLLQGRGPVGDLVEDPVGNVYGVTNAGGDFNGGTLFELHPDGNLEVLYSFNPAGWGGHPYSGLVRGADGSLYGTLPASESTPAILYQWQAGGSWVPRAVLPAQCGGNVYDRPAVDAVGNVYVADVSYGCVVRVDLTGKTRILKYTRKEYLRGLMMGQDGNLYYTVSGRVGNVCGGIDRITPEGVVSRVRAFACKTNYVSPQGALTQTPDGLLHGNLIRYEGTSGKYSVFTIATDGSGFTEARVPAALGSGVNTLSAAPDGSLYATASGRKPPNGGVVVRITP